MFYMKRQTYIPPEEEYVPYEDKYEKNVNVYSCLNFFRELCDREKLKATDKEDHAKKLKMHLIHILMLDLNLTLPHDFIFRN